MSLTPRRSRLVAAFLTVVLAVALAATSGSVSAAGGTFVAQVKATLGIAPAAPAASVEEFDTRAGATPFAPTLRPVSDDSPAIRAATASAGAPDSVETVSDRYIVVFREAPLASYDGNVPGYAKPERLPGKARLNVKSDRAKSYVEYLKGRQASHEAKIGKALGRSVDVSLRMQHAVNAIVAAMSPAEAAQVASMPEVLLVDPVRDVPLDTDVGPAFIGAGPLWDGTNPGSTGPVRGEGTVIGVIDSGINFGSPSFAASDPIDGYAHVNPLGAGTYLGTCAPGQIDDGRCNAKLIGGYDFVCAALGTCAPPPVGIREEPGFGDTNGHGSHTASTVAGNNRDVVVSGATRRISGVAPRANVIAYDVCYTNTSTGQGLCPNVSSAAAVNQAIADGVVDAINFSIGGGSSPWTDTVSLAFLSATDAGIYVATSAGNSGPGANTMGHLEPWTASTAAAQHGRSAFVFVLNATGPGTPPANVAAVPVNPGTGGVAFAASIPGSTPFVVSPGIDTTSDGCAAYPAGTFTGAIALVRRGTCSFAVKANSAAAAGAIAMVLANNTTGGIIPSVPGTTIPVFGATQADGDNLRNWGQANPTTATAGIPFPATVTANTPDQLASFSSRGPAGTFDLLKPDVTAPGVSILAAVAGTTITGFESAVALYDGTSMASPHNAGSSLLLRQLKPSWSVPEIKSALEMTAKRTVLKEDGATPATPFDMGGGRVRVDRAANAGLLLHETTASFTAANPGAAGDPTTLNIPSYAKNGCSNCQFVRTFRSPLGTSRTWTASVTGLTGTVTPSTFTVPAGGTVALTTAIDTSAMAPNGVFNFGWLELVPSGGTPDDALTLPLAITVLPPAVTLVPPSQNVTLYEGLLGSASFDVRNVGGDPLTWAVDQTGQGLATVYAADSTGISSGFRNTIYTDPATAGNLAQFAADDFTVTTPTTIASLFAEGFTVSGGALASVAADLTWSIYPDAGGLPAGNPQTASGAATWTYTATPTATGVTTSGANGISLDLVAAGQSVTLAPGRYWLVVNTRSTFANRWAQYASNTGTGGGFASITIATAGTGAWAANTSFAGLTFRVTGTIPCGASWIGGSTPTSGSLSGGASEAITTQLSAVGVAAGTYVGTVCLATNDPARPKVAEILNLTVTAPPAGVANQLVFTTPPAASGVAGTAWSPQPVVTVQDIGGATVTGYADPVTLSLASGTGPLVCDQNPVTPVNGVAAFSGCHVDAVGVVTLTATSGIIPGSTTNPAVTISAGPPSQLVFTVPPSSTAPVGQPWPQQPVVTATDAFGNPATAPVLLTLDPPGGLLVCDANPVTPVNGVATFTGCRVGIPGSYTLNASSGPIASATTTPTIVIAEGFGAVVPALGNIGLAALGLLLGLAGVLALRRAV